MALQGNIDSFSVVDVLRLLASSTKSGRLVVDGDRGPGRVRRRGEIGEQLGERCAPRGPAALDEGGVQRSRDRLAARADVPGVAAVDGLSTVAPGGPRDGDLGPEVEVDHGTPDRRDAVALPERVEPPVHGALDPAGDARSNAAESTARRGSACCGRRA